METEKELSVRIHYDWFNQCRSCQHWLGDRAINADGVCNNYKSDLFFQETCGNGHCKEWDSFDYETAFEVIDGKWDHIHNPSLVNVILPKKID